MRVLAPDSYAFHSAFGSIVVDAETSIIEIRPQPFETGQAIADRTGQRRLADHKINKVDELLHWR